MSDASFTSQDPTRAAADLAEIGAGRAGFPRRRRRKRRDRILIISEHFPPDPASPGWHMADVAEELARRGFRVCVYAGNCSADGPPAGCGPGRQTPGGVDVMRLPLSRFRTKAVLMRMLGTASFMIQAFIRGLFLPNIAGVIVGTSPPLVGTIATTLRMFRGMPVVYWAMDLIPDQLLATKKIPPRSMSARAIEAVNRTSLNNSTLVVVPDRFMADRLYPRARLDDKLVVIPPWPHHDVTAPPPQDQSSFRRQHGLDGKFVIMHSGNQNPGNPLITLLDAAVRLKDDDSIKFVFVGRGEGTREIDQYLKRNTLPHVISLPSEPLESLRPSLCAADVHVVSMGDNMAGIAHPCEVYAAMAVGRPVLYIGPRPSPVSDLLDRDDFGRHVSHGDVDACVAAIKSLQSLSQAQREDMGLRGQRLLAGRLSRNVLCKRFCDGLELAFEKRM